jgi:ribosome-binding factor A
MAKVRQNRINSQMQTVLAEAIQKELQDPRLDGAIVSVLKADVSADLSHAKIYVSIFGTDEKKAFNAILNSVPYLRKIVAKKVQLRIVPQLHFILDKSIDHASNINSILNKIKKDDEDKNS